MKKIVTTVLAFFALKSAILAQTVTAVGIVTLTGAPNTPMMIAFNPFFNLYYASSGGGGCNQMMTYTVTGGAPISNVSVCYDARGSWWNTNTNVLEGNGYNGSGIYTVTLNGSGIPTGAGAFFPAGNTQPDQQSMGSYDAANNNIIYYFNGQLIKRNRTTNVLVATISITGLPVGLGNLTNYCGFFTGTPGKEYAVFDYVNRRAYYINYNTGAFVSTVQFPPTAGAPNNYSLSYSNGLFFICNGSTWIGYNICPKINSNPTSGIICSGSSVSLTAIGAVSYTWNTGALTTSIISTPSVNTTYSIIASPTIAGCSNTAAITITVNASPTLAITGNTLICGTGTNVLTASGANTYSWSNGALTSSISVSPSVTTNYSVIGTNTLGSCTNSFTTSITVSSNPTVAIAGPTAAICAGSAFSLNASGANTYSWSNGAVTSSIAPSPTANTSYTVVGTNSVGCFNSAVSNITVNPVPSVSVAGAGTICAGETSTLSASGANTYSWNTGATTSTIVVTPTANTSYTVIGTSSVTGCMGVISVNIVVDPCTGIKQSMVKNSGFKVFPNPTSGDLTIELDNGLNKTIEISDVTGRLVLSNTSSKDKVNVNINHLANGVYYVKVLSNNAVEVIKIVKQ